MSISIKPGYKGLAEIGGTKVRCTSFTLNPTQDVLFYNHTIGLKDTSPFDSATKKEDIEKINTQRRIWRPSTVSIAGGISFPATEQNIEDLYQKARKATNNDDLSPNKYFDIDYNYYCGGSGIASRRFTDCRVNSFDFNAVAGDIVNITMDFMCRGVEESNFLPSYTKAEKLITWDKVKVTFGTMPFPFNSIIQNVNLKINNNLNAIYVVNDKSTPYPESLSPYDIRVGMQEVSGTVSVFLSQGEEFIPINLAEPTTMTIVLPTLTINTFIVFKTNQIEGITGPIVTQIPFVGVDKALGE